jgi:hypothetical protein
MELVRKLDGWNGFVELYKRGDQYIVVSTIQEEDRPTDPFLAGHVQMTELLSIFTEPEPLPAHGEETMAWYSDAEGHIEEGSWHPALAQAFGDDSRAKVIKQLQENQ